MTSDVTTESNVWQNDSAPTEKENSTEPQSYRFSWNQLMQAQKSRNCTGNYNNYLVWTPLDLQRNKGILQSNIQEEMLSREELLFKQDGRV